MVNFRKTFTLIALSGAFALGGCGDTERAASPFAPDTTYFQPKIVAYEPVPTDLVIAVDVSDSTDADELSATVDALVATLTDPLVFDPDGTTSVAVVAYGDTTALVVEPLTALDASSGVDVFTPALEGLEADRLVAGSAAVLDEAMTEAAELLAAGSAGNAHLVVIGGGQDVDAAAIAERCTALSDAGIRFHAVGLAATEAGAALLGECATATSGSFVAAADPSALDAAVRAVLSRVSVVQLELSPETAELDRGTEHTVTATLTRGLDDGALPLEGVQVIFEVGSGPSEGLRDTTVTDASGEATFTLVGDVPPGTDDILAHVEHPDGDVTLTTAVQVTWLNQAPTCEPGGPYAVTVDADTVRVTLDGSASVDAEDDPLTFLWAVDGEGLSLGDADSSVTELVITGAATCQDTLEVTLSVGDGFDTSTCVARIALDDQRPPVLMPESDPIVLWPPNHRMHVITPEMTLAMVEDACGGVTVDDVVVLSVTSDEAFDELGSGQTRPDVVIDCDGTVQLRAERSGGGDGRVYTIEYAVTDADGQTTTLEVEVLVPHDSSGRSVVAGPIQEMVMADCEGSSR